MADVVYPWELYAYISKDNKLKVKFSRNSDAGAEPFEGTACYVSVLETANPMAAPDQKDVTSEISSGSGGEVEFDVNAMGTYEVYLQETPGWGHIANRVRITVVKANVTHASTSSTDNATIEFTPSLSSFSNPRVEFVRPDKTHIILTLGTHYTISGNVLTITGATAGMWTENYDHLEADLGGTIVHFDPKGTVAPEPSAKVAYWQKNYTNGGTSQEAWLEIVNPDGEDVKVYSSSTLLATIPWVASNEKKTVVATATGAAHITKIVIGTEEFAQSGYPILAISASQDSLAQAVCYNAGGSGYGFVNDIYDMKLKYGSDTSTKSLDPRSSSNRCAWNMSDFPNISALTSAATLTFESVGLFDYDYIENGEWKHGTKKRSGTIAGVIFGTPCPPVASINPDNSVTLKVSPGCSKINQTGEKLYLDAQLGTAPRVVANLIELAPGQDINELVIPTLCGAGTASSGALTGVFFIRNSAGQSVQTGATALGTLPTLSSSYDTKVFKRWLKDGLPYDFNTPVTSNITLTGDWSEAYKVKFVDYDGTELAPAQTVVQGSDFGLVLPTNPTRDGFTFNGWRNMNNAEMWDNSSMTVTSNMTLAATYTKNS